MGSQLWLVLPPSRRLLAQGDSRGFLKMSPTYFAVHKQSSTQN